jgi:hypothetical protein
MPLLAASFGGTPTLIVRAPVGRSDQPDLARRCGDDHELLRDLQVAQVVNE